jgi:hypothetical protein
MSYVNSGDARIIIDNFKKYNPHVCYLCGKQITENDDLTVDHKIPHSRGGKTKESNLAICCRACNDDKADMTVEEYKNYLVQKQTITKECQASIYTNDILNTYNKITDDYANTVKIINNKLKEKSELENIIRTSNCNAAEGYYLYKRLKEVLIEIDSAVKKQKDLSLINDHARQNKTQILKLHDDILQRKIKDLRNSMGISRLKTVVGM